MPAAATDKFMKVGDPGTATTLSAPGYTIGNTSITVASTTNFPTDTGVIFGIDRAEVVNGQEVRVAGSYCVFAGVVTSSTAIGSLSLLYGTPQDYPAGALTRVYITVSALHNNRMVDGLLTSFDQDGTLKAGAVDVAAVLASDVVTTAKILDGNVTTAKLANGSVTVTKLASGSTRLGLNRNAGGTLPASPTWTTYATLTATSTGKECEVWWGAKVTNGNSGASRTFDVQVLCDGSAITPTSETFTATYASGEYPAQAFTFMHSSTPAAGSHTWSLQMRASSGSAVVLGDNFIKVIEVA